MAIGTSCSGPKAPERRRVFFHPLIHLRIDVHPGIALDEDLLYILCHLADTSQLQHSLRKLDLCGFPVDDDTKLVAFLSKLDALEDLTIRCTGVRQSNSHLLKGLHWPSACGHPAGHSQSGMGDAASPVGILPRLRKLSFHQAFFDMNLLQSVV